MKKYLTRRSAALAMSLLFSSPLFFSANVVAEDEFVCEARQNSTSELPVLSQACPIGKGLWGKMKPARKDDLFWIQCGIYPKPVSLEEAKPIYQSISVDVWLKPEGNEYRCLIGPYDNYVTARKELIKVRKLSGLEEAFIRTVNTKAKAQPAKKKKESSAPKKVETAVKPSAVTPTKDVKKADKPVISAKPETAMPETKPADNQSIVIRREASIQGKKFVIPFLMESNEQFYMEYNIAWNRLSYAKAGEVCSSLDMSLVNEDNWKLLINSKIMSSKQWPLHLPYWGDGKRGLFTSGKITQLTGTSLLNVICVR